MPRFCILSPYWVSPHIPVNCPSPLHNYSKCVFERICTSNSRCQYFTFYNFFTLKYVKLLKMMGHLLIFLRYSFDSYVARFVVTVVCFVQTESKTSIDVPTLLKRIHLEGYVEEARSHIHQALISKSHCCIINSVVLLFTWVTYSNLYLGSQIKVHFPIDVGFQLMHDFCWMDADWHMNLN